MSDELKPCPFCGGEAEMREGSSTKPYIRCKRCGCRTGSSRYRGNLAKAWNARADVTDGQFATAVHDGEAWQRVRECHIRYHGGMVSEGGMEAEDWYYCDACGEELPKWAQDAWDEYATFDFEGAMPFRHCPECGARVVR